ncbi:hypothetical protein C8F04DRAFT_1176910 [Mycena alexandri]|uniref:Uncharacterized protein n=1 Tax=Mycena alexandri TaxID=1745969 RepID=A0AAD6TCI4_9AGAR|nr:hypothetical protein C8F04DRAFT_1176910 [Mycena alexandri]
MNDDSWFHRASRPRRAKQRRAVTRRQQAEEDARRLRNLPTPRRRSVRIERIRRARFYASPIYPYHVALAREITPLPSIFRHWDDAIDAQWSLAKEGAIDAQWASASGSEQHDASASKPAGSGWAGGGWGDDSPPVIDDRWRGWEFTSEGVWTSTQHIKLEPDLLDDELATP